MLISALACGLGPGHSRDVQEAVEVLEGERAVLDVAAVDDDLSNGLPLSDGLLGYAWPKCVRAGEQSEFRVHAVEQYHVEL